MTSIHCLTTQLVTNAEEVELSIPYVNKFFSRSLSLDEYRKAVRLKFFRLCTLYCIKDADGNKVRFTPNVAQTEYYKESRPKDIILKARQLGFTTFKMVHDLDSCLFKKNFSAGCIAHNDNSAKDIFRNKIKFAYQSISPASVGLLEKIGYKLPVPLTDKNGMYVFSNGSSIGVSTGYRGDTLQSLHVSELGKIAKKFPDRAQEIKTGAFPAASGGNSTITIESTAEGRAGMFYEYCATAKKLNDLGQDPHVKQFKFHFFPWWKDPKYVADGGVDIPEVLLAYFDQLENKFNVKLTDNQKCWYSLTWADQGDKMKQEYPSTPDEAFEQAIEGAYYANQFRDIYKEGRIVDDIESLLGNTGEVNTVCDIGIGDSTSIWFYRVVGDEYHILHYHENSGEGLGYYIKYIQDKLTSKGWVGGKNYGPHDMNNREFASGGKTRKEMAAEGVTYGDKTYSMKFEIVPKLGIGDGIQSVRSILPKCVFDHKSCELGINALESYRKEWNEKLGCWRDNPLHDWSSHGSDAFRYLAVAESKRKPITNVKVRFAI